MPRGIEQGVRLQAGGKVRDGYKSAGWSWLADVGESVVFGTVGSVRWLVSYGREAMVFGVAWWLLGRWLPEVVASLVVLVAGGAYCVVGTRIRAHEAERRDLLQAERDWPRAKELVRRMRWQPGRPEAWAVAKDGTPIPALTPGNHILLGGMTRAGKSTAVNGLLYVKSTDPHVHMVGIDLKDGLELAAWTPRMDAVVEDHKSAEVLLDQVSEFIHRRNQSLKQRGLKSVADDPTTRWAELLVVLDELQELMTGHEGLQTRLESIARRGGSAGVWLISTTQLPSAKAIGSTYRAQHGVNVVMRTRSRQDADVMAGQGVLGERAALEERGVWVPWEGNIQPPDRPDAGRALLISDGLIREVRFLYRSDAEVAARAQETAARMGPKLIDMPAMGGGKLAEHRKAKTEGRPDGEPSTSWLRAQLAEEIVRLGGDRPDLSNRHRPTRQQLLDEIAKLKVSA